GAEVRFQRTTATGGTAAPLAGGAPGTFTSTPGGLWNGADHFRYTVYDAAGNELGSAVVSIGTGYNGYTYFSDLQSDSKNDQVVPAAKGGLLLGGGGTIDNPAVYQGYGWFIQHTNGDAAANGDNSKGGDIVVLDAGETLGDNEGQAFRNVASLF